MGLPCDWQISKQKVAERGQYLLETGQWSDCKFIVGQEPHQQTLKGHKLFLAMSSPVFEAMFFGGMAEKNEPISICDVQPDAFKALLEYIYTDHVKLTSFELACELCYCAKKYMLPYLVEECTKYLWSDLSPKKACRAYEFAKLFEEPVLMEKCLQIICTKTSDVLKESSWEEVELGTLNMILEQEELQVESEIELFTALERWAKAECARKSLDNSDSKALKSVIGDALSKIRFLTLTPKEFIEGVGVSPLLEQSEAYSILWNILSSGNNPFKPMPEGFSTSTQSRAKNQIINLSCPGIKIPVPERFSDDSQSRNKSLKAQSRGFNIPDHMAHNALHFQLPSSCLLHTPWRNRYFGSRNFKLSSKDRQRMINDDDGPSTLNDSPSMPSILDSTIRRGINDSVNLTMNTSPLEINQRREIDNTLTVSLDNDALRRGINVPVNGESSSSEREGTRDGPKYYCRRTLIQQTDCLNTNVLDSSVTFSVDKNICVMGVQVPTQIPGAANSLTHGVPDATYTEILYAHLLDSDGSRLTYTHFTTKVAVGTLVEVMFNRPVYIQKHKVYRVGVVFNKVGWYPMGLCTQHLACDSVFFSFGVGNSADSIRDGLIRSIIFTY